MKRFYNLIRRPLVLVLMVLLIILLFQRLQIFSGIGNWFKAKPVLIDNTPLVIKEIKSIAELNTATMYQEIVVDSSSITSSSVPVMINPFSLVPRPVVMKKEIVLIIKGRVTAGIDLKNLSDKEVFVEDDSVSIAMPPARITDVFLNPSGIETFYEEGTWTNEEVTLVKESARRKLLAEAGRQQLLQKADAKARAVVEQFLRAAQFKKIHIHQAVHL
ncbi:MAG: DUF4230 domain-containing protein [Bacteroidota bacterium]